MHWDLITHRIVKTTKLKRQYIEMHSHPFFHLIYQLSGHCAVTVDGQKYDTETGSLIICAPGVLHEIRSLNTSTAIDLKFSCSDSFTEKLRDLPKFYRHLDQKASSLIRNAFEEAVDPKPDYDEFINLRIYELMLYLLRIREQSNSPHYFSSIRSQDVKDPIMHNALAYIEHHLNNKLLVSELAAQSGYSENHFRNYFTQTIGITPNRYIYERKISRAQELMLFTDSTITEISEQLGYQSIHYFSRQFKLLTGMTPSDYIEKTKHTLNINVVENENTPANEYELPLLTAEEPPIKIGL